MNITKPTFVIDRQTCLANIEKMALKAKEHKLRFRPHFKTHQSADIANWFRENGVTAITVSSVSMASYFASHGWKDITIAFPVNLLEIDDINRLAADIRLNLLVENEYSLELLSEQLTSPAGIYIEIDTGYHRTGIDSIKTARIDLLLKRILKNRLLQFKGFLSHTGQTYAATSRELIVSRHTDALMKMRSLKEFYLPEFPGLEISLGDTPACSVCDNWQGADEIRPGNFVFYDLMQWQIGSCAPEQIAATVVCPVVSKFIGRSEVVIYGGAVHLSKEFIIGPNGKKCYGGVISQDNNSGEKTISSTLWVTGLSQEHGIVRGEFEEIRKIQPGDLLEIVPVHSCLAADLSGHYLTTAGEILHKMEK
ncbi:MAG TPA: alanine racemase [Prolixibacteraceae bacterium]|nr:alanine racemase [Prolixibacteraceae bacterium]